MSILLLHKIMQLFVILIIGFILAKTKIVKSTDGAVLSKLCLYILMPSAIINAFDFKLSQHSASGFLLAFVAALVIHFIFLILDKAYIKLWGHNAVERASVMYSNAGNLIIPLVTFVLGEEWVMFSMAYLSVQIIFLWTHGIHLFSPDTRYNVKKILCNINIIAIVIGIGIMLSGCRLPSFAKDIVASFGDMLGTVGMLIAGILAANVNFKQVFSNKRMYLIVFLRMIVYPIIILIALKILALIPIVNSDKILFISFLASITPSAATVMQFAQIKNSNADYAVAINVVTTIVCIVTMPLFVVLYNCF